MKDRKLMLKISDTRPSPCPHCGGTLKIGRGGWVLCTCPEFTNLYFGPGPYGIYTQPAKPKEFYENAEITSEDIHLINYPPESVKAAEKAGVIWHCDGSRPMECPSGPHAKTGVWHFKPKKNASDLP